MKRIFLGVFMFACLAPFATSAAESINARILPSIWYSQLSTEDGKSIDVHAGIQNNSGLGFSGTTFLYVDDVLIGQKDFTSEADSLKDVYVTWKATAGQHVFQMKVSASIPSDKDLISYKSDLSYMSVSNTMTFESVKDNVTGAVTSTASTFIEKADAVAETIVKNLEAAKKEPTETKAEAKTEGEVKGASTEKPSFISSVLASNQAAAVYNGGIDALAFLVEQWKWTLSALALVGLFLFLKSKAIF